MHEREYAHRPERPVMSEHLSDVDFEQLRDAMAITSRRMSKEQILQLSDDLHTLLRRRGEHNWRKAKQGTAGFC